MCEKTHFIGINGSGASGVAIAAKKLGFAVTGCDGSADTPYAAQVRAAGIPIVIGHDAAHVPDADIIVASPALLYQQQKHPEICAAEAAGKLMTWQKFLGTRILPGRRTVTVCGTHGKTTTTGMMAHIMECAEFDPTAFVGAIMPDWNSSNRFGASDWVVLEADEYANNFAHYSPEYIILNNIEMEHPEYFKDFEHYMRTFCDFLAGAAAGGTLVYNADDANAALAAEFYSGKKVPFSAAQVSIAVQDEGQNFNGFRINLLGAHNVSNAIAATTMAREIGIKDDVIKKALATFRGAGHRCEKIFDDGRILVYDDYAHHHTQAKNIIIAIRTAYPDARIVAVYEPHQISRYVQHSDETLRALSLADDAIITEFWRGREAHLPIPDVVADITAGGFASIRYMPDDDKAFTAAADAAAEHTGRVVVAVLGAGKSWKIANRLKEFFSK